jgi:hypothetical protein
MNDLPVPNVETYLGDGLYVSFDGWQISLRAPRDGGDHFVSLEPDVFRALLDWVTRHPALLEHFRVSEP